MPSGVTKTFFEFGMVLDQFPGGLSILLEGAARERLSDETEEAEETLERPLLVSIQVLVEDLDSLVTTKESGTAGEGPLARLDVRDRFLELDPEGFVSDGWRTLQTLPFARPCGELQGQEVAKDVSSPEVDHLQIPHPPKSGPYSFLGAISCMVVEDPKTEMRRGVVERLREEGLEIGDGVPTSEIDESLHEFVARIQVMPVGIEDLARDPYGSMAVQEAGEMIRPTSLIRQDDEPVSFVHSTHEGPRLDSAAIMGHGRRRSKDESGAIPEIAAIHPHGSVDGMVILGLASARIGMRTQAR